MRVIYFTHNRYKQRNAMPSCRISYYDITFMFSGEMTWHVNGKSYAVSEGDVFLIKKDSLRGREPLYGADYISFNFYTDEKVDLPMHIKGAISQEVRLLLSACDEVHSGNPDGAEILAYILCAILEQLKVNINTQKLSPLVLNIKRYVSKHIHEAITLENITAATFFSSVYCSAVFKREVGKSIIDYVLEEKVKLAKRYILENTPLKAVAAALGYSDYNYFSRMFKKKTGITPTQYKNSLSS